MDDTIPIPAPLSYYEGIEPVNEFVVCLFSSSVTRSWLCYCSIVISVLQHMLPAVLENIRFHCALCSCSAVTRMSLGFYRS